ncbi:sigma-70 family RNA polymerase sigma factor [Blautia sp.]|uniref:sigma-70 family RNA polymerase sigma factor n=1 Tax=Blautia sp. TaxID=1955243 RepID=UPI003AB26DB3
MNCGKEIDENINYCPYCGHKTMYIKEEKAEITKEQLEEAVQKFQKGDESAFDIIYKGVSKTAFVLVNSFFPEEKSEHEDIVQDIFIHTYKKIGLYNPKLASFTTWFHKVAENKCIDRYRASRKKNAGVISMESLTMDEDDKKAVEFKDERIEFNPDAVMERNEISRLIRELLEHLPEKQKQCLMLKFLAHYDIQEIAEKLEIPVGTVKSRLFKGKENLSAQVYAMEKRGVKLYNMSPVAFFIWLLTQEVEAEASALSPSSILRAMATTAETWEESILEQQAETSVADTAPESADVQTEPVIEPEVHPAAEAAPMEGIAEAVSSGASVAGKAVATKVIGAIAGIALLAGGGFAIANAFDQDGQAEQPKTAIEEPVSEERIEEEISLISLFEDEEKKKQLENILTIAPEFDKENPIDAEKLWNDVFAKSITNIVTLKSGSTDLPVTPIVDLNDVEIELAKPEIVVPSTAYDPAFDALGISQELLSELEGQGMIYEDSGKMHIVLGQGALGPYTASISDMTEKGDILEVSFALSYDSVDIDIPPSNGDEKYTAIIESSDNSLGYQITSVKQEENPQLAIYQTLIDDYGSIYYSGGEPAADYISFDCGIFNPYHGMPLTSEYSSQIYYALYDINGDGFEECLFTSDPGIEKTDYPGYYDIWTNDGTEVHHVLAGGYRSFQIITENGEILNGGSGGATMGGYDVYSFTSKGETNVVDSYFYETYNDDIEAEIADFLESYPKRGITLRWFSIPEV